MPEVAMLKIAGVTGGGPGGEIEIDSWSFGVSNSTSVGGGTSPGKASLSDFTISKPVDQATPQIFKLALSGTPIPTVVLVVIFRADQTSGTGGETLTITFEEVLISSYKVDQGRNGNSGSGAPSPCPPAPGGTPTEFVSFVYGQVEIQYQTQT